MAPHSSLFRNLATRLMAAFCLLISMVLGSVETIAQTTMVLGDRGFVKTAQVQCDKVRYKIFYYNEISPMTPQPITISDVWPVGTLQGTIISATGMTKKFGSSAAPLVETATLSVTAAGWSAIFPGITALPSGGIAYGGYEIEVEAPIDPTKFVGGQLVITNQAKTQVYTSTFTSNDAVAHDPYDPNFVYQPTVVTISEADYRKCSGQSGGNGQNSGNNEPPVSTACLTPDTKVTCGKVPGTYVITLNAATGGSYVPSEVSVDVTTPGVTIVAHQPKYVLNSSGQLQLTLSGATPGQTITFDISGSKLDPKSDTGMSTCCAGKITITIPKDLKCDQKTVDVAIHKEGKTSPPPNVPWYSWDVKVTNEGPAFNAMANQLTMTDTVPPGMTFTSFTVPTGWTCLPPVGPITAGNTLSCKYAGGPLAAGPGTVVGTFSIVAMATGKGPFPPFTNCAHTGLGGFIQPETNLANNKDCATVSKPNDHTVSVEKKCGPVTFSKYAQGPAIDALGYHANCTITVTTTGPQTGPMTVSDNMTGGNAYMMTSTSTPAWACSGTSCNINSSTLNQTSSVSTFNVVVGFANANDVNKAQNCAEVTGAAKKACVPFKVDLGKLTVVKEAVYNGHHITNQSFPATLTCGSSANPITITDGTPYVQTGLPIGASCSVVEASTTPAAGLCPVGTTPSWNTSYAPATPVVVTSAGATIMVTNKLVCTPIIIDHPSTQTVTKVCEPAKVLVGAINHYQAKCHITVSTTGPQSGTLSVTDTLTGAGTLGSATAPAPWACSAANCSVNGSALNQTASTSVIDINVTFPTAGHVSEGKNCATLTTNGTPVESCTTFTVADAKTGLAIIKRVVSHAPDVFPSVQFPISATCDASVQSITDGQTITVNNLATGTPCTVTEAAISGTVQLAGVDACSGAGKPVWTTTYAPSQTVNAGPGAAVTITNTLNCERVATGMLSIKKEVISHAELPLGPMQFSITANCLGNPMPSLTQSLSDGETKPFQNYVAGTSCTVQEAVPGPTNACGKMIPQWTTTYIPPTTLSNFPNGGTVVVRNQLDCICPHNLKSVNGQCIESPPPPACDPKTAKLVGKECRCTVPGMVPVSKTSCDCPKGQDVRNGRCQEPPPPPPKCDRATTVAQGQSCVCRFDHMGKTSDTSCRCDRGYQFAPGKGCIKLPPDCPQGSRYNTNRNRCEPVCNRGERYDAAKNRCLPIIVAPRCDRVTAVPKGDSCVCRYDGMVKRGPGSCRCAVRGSVFVPGKGCMERQKPRETRCPFPLIPNPLNGKCMRLDIQIPDINPGEPDPPVDQPKQP